MVCNRSIFRITLHDFTVGTLQVSQDVSIINFSDSYVNDPDRCVLSLNFEERLREPNIARGMHPWFANIFPEGGLSDVLKKTFRIDSRTDELEQLSELLRNVGHDLPGAVQVLPVPSETDPGHIDVSTCNSRGIDSDPIYSPLMAPAQRFRFSLAGVQMKFSAGSSNGRYTMPASSGGARWLIKPPSAQFEFLPENERAVMELADHVGISVAQTELVHRDQFALLPEGVWPANSPYGLAVERFDREPGGKKVHIEDFAQVIGRYPKEKYSSNFETVGSIAYRGHDAEALVEFAKRLAFNIFIGNSDAHLKNWSLWYPDGRKPTLAPAYDLVSVVAFPAIVKDIGLKFGNRKIYMTISLESFDRLARKVRFEECSLTELVRDFLKVMKEDAIDRLEFYGMAQTHLLNVKEHIQLMSATWDL